MSYPPVNLIFLIPSTVRLGYSIHKTIQELSKCKECLLCTTEIYGLNCSTCVYYLISSCPFREFKEETGPIPKEEDKKEEEKEKEQEKVTEPEEEEEKKERDEGKEQAEVGFKGSPTKLISRGL